ncbi:hypothetical protein [Novosphingobium sp. 9]|uniref:hypothetical protein n=1 Tax=Novosphingobium sp. 9 TaxID=2025349 RepID=UPI0028CB1378|nr:hypothetical protein [Novosphingobium sp. 9]
MHVRAHRLANSNQTREAPIPDLSTERLGETVVTDRARTRTIPARAREWRWAVADGQELRRIEWAPVLAEGEAARGSLMFVPGRGDAYEKWLESLNDWSDAGWHVASFDWRGRRSAGGSARMR